MVKTTGKGANLHPIASGIHKLQTFDDMLTQK